MIYGKGRRGTGGKKSCFKATSKTIGKLEGNKRYYVKIRSYKKVKAEGKTKKIYSGWPKGKTVTAKK